MLCGVYIFHIFRKDAVNVYLSNPITCLNRNFSLVRMSIGLDRFHCTSHVFVYRLRRLTRFPPYSVTMRVPYGGKRARLQRDVKKTRIVTEYGGKRVRRLKRYTKTCEVQ